jgi:hypothetical protein
VRGDGKFINENKLQMFTLSLSNLSIKFEPSFRINSHSLGLFDNITINNSEIPGDIDSILLTQESYLKHSSKLPKSQNTTAVIVDDFSLLTFNNSEWTLTQNETNLALSQIVTTVFTNFIPEKLGISLKNLLQPPKQIHYSLVSSSVYENTFLPETWNISLPTKKKFEVSLKGNGWEQINQAVILQIDRLPNTFDIQLNCSGASKMPSLSCPDFQNKIIQISEFVNPFGVPKFPVPPTPQPIPESGSGLTVAQIVTISVGSVLVVGAIVFVVIFFIIRHKKSASDEPPVYTEL